MGGSEEGVDDHRRHADGRHGVPQWFSVCFLICVRYLVLFPHLYIFLILCWGGRDKRVRGRGWRYDLESLGRRSPLSLLSCSLHVMHAPFLHAWGLTTMLHSIYRCMQDIIHLPRPLGPIEMEVTSDIWPALGTLHRPSLSDAVVSLPQASWLWPAQHAQHSRCVL